MNPSEVNVAETVQTHVALPCPRLADSIHHIHSDQVIAAEDVTLGTDQPDITLRYAFEPNLIARLKIHDDVVAVAGAEDKHVSAGTTCQSVGIETAIQKVITGAAVNIVVTAVPNQEVVTWTAMDDVIAIPTVE